MVNVDAPSRAAGTPRGADTCRRGARRRSRYRVIPAGGVPGCQRRQIWRHPTPRRQSLRIGLRRSVGVDGDDGSRASTLGERVPASRRERAARRHHARRTTLALGAAAPPPPPAAAAPPAPAAGTWSCDVNPGGGFTTAGSAWTAAAGTWRRSKSLPHQAHSDQSHADQPAAVRADTVQPGPAYGQMIQSSSIRCSQSRAVVDRFHLVEEGLLRRFRS